jgi:hypothetical protein
MKKLFTLLTLILCLSQARAQISTFPTTEGFESPFTTGLNVAFIPNWTGNEVAFGTRIFADSLNARTGSRGLGIIPTSSFSPTVDVALNLTGISNMSADFWAKSVVNGTGDREAVMYFSTSIDGGVTFSTPIQIGDTSTFPNASTNYANYTYPFPFNTFNQSNVILRIAVTRGNGISGGTAGRIVLDDFTLTASAGDIFPPTVLSASATSQSSVTITFSEPVGVSAESIGNYSGLTAITSAVRSSGNSVVTLSLSTPLTEGTIYTLNVSSIADLVGNVMNPAQQFSIVFNDNTGNIKITELLYNNPGTDSLEFIEIKNLDASTINIGGWRFSDGVDGLFPSNLTIQPGQYIVFAKYQQVVNDFFNINSYAWEITNSLNNAGETVAISNAQGTLIDSVAYGIAAPWDSIANGYGPSLTLCSENADNDLASSWTTSLDFTGLYFGGTTTDSIFATPGTGCITVGLETLISEKANIIVSPNPVTNVANLNFYSSKVENLTLSIFDISGRLVASLIVKSNSGINSIILPTETLDKGTYIASLNSSEKVITTKFIKL